METLLVEFFLRFCDNLSSNGIANFNCFFLLQDWSLVPGIGSLVSLVSLVSLCIGSLFEKRVHVQLTKNTPGLVYFCARRHPCLEKITFCLYNGNVGLKSGSYNDDDDGIMGKK